MEEKPIAIILSGETQCFSSEIRNKTKISIRSTSIQHSTRVLAREIRQITQGITYMWNLKYKKKKKNVELIETECLEKWSPSSGGEGNMGRLVKG